MPTPPDASDAAPAGPAKKPKRSKRAAGILLWRRTPAGGVEVLVAHMGGPQFAKRTTGTWSIPKGEYLDDEEPFDAARREFAEELGHPVPAREFRPLGSVTQSSGKVVTAWAAEGDLDPATCVSNTFELEWPPRSGRVREFPEIDEVAWMTPDAAKALVIAGQAELVDRLVALVADEANDADGTNHTDEADDAADEADDAAGSPADDPDAARH